MSRVKTRAASRSLVAKSREPGFHPRGSSVYEVYRLRWLAVSRRIAALLALFVLRVRRFIPRSRAMAGALRVELLATSITLDPRGWKPGSRDFATNERLAALVFDRLISLDNYGHFVPQLPPSGRMIPRFAAGSSCFAQA